VEEGAPLIVTCGLDDASFRFFDDLRRAHFPAERNHLSAHLTLFHHLPGDRCEDVQAALIEAASAEPPPIAVTGLRKLGGGVAYALQSDALSAVRGAIAERFARSLTAQDRQAFRPHVTVQNKVSAPEAAALFDQLSARFAAFSARGVSLQLWRYRGGPWEAAGEYPFRGAAAD